MNNSGVYFINCVCFGRKFIKIGHSEDVKTRRNDLQTGCPFLLKIEHVEPMPISQAIKKERQWHALFSDMLNRREWQKAETGASVRLTFNWFPYENEIQDFVENLKKSQADAATSESKGKQQQRLF